MNTIKNPLQIIMIGLMMFCNVLLIPSSGTADDDNWSGIIRTVGGNPSVRQMQRYLTTYEFPVNYPPGHFLIAYAIGALPIARTMDSHILMKISIFASYVLTYAALCIFISVARRTPVRFNDRSALFLFFVTWFSLTINTQGLGYTDVYFMPFLICAAAAVLVRSWFLAGFFLSLASLMKWIPIMIVPLFAVYALKSSSGHTWQRIMRFAAGVAIPFMLLWALNRHLPARMTASLVTYAMQDPFLTAALNIHWVANIFYLRFLPDQYRIFEWSGFQYAVFEKWFSLSWILLVPKVLFAVFYFHILSRMYKSDDSSPRPLLLAATVASGGYFFFSTGVHENHLMLSVAFSVLLYALTLKREDLSLFRALNFLAASNMVYFYGIWGTPPPVRYLFGYDTSIILSLVLTGVFVSFAQRALKRL